MQALAKVMTLPLLRCQSEVAVAKVGLGSHSFFRGTMSVPRHVRTAPQGGKLFIVSDDSVDKRLIVVFV